MSGVLCDRRINLKTKGKYTIGPGMMYDARLCRENCKSRSCMIGNKDVEMDEWSRETGQKKERNDLGGNESGRNSQESEGNWVKVEWTRNEKRRKICLCKNEYYCSSSPDGGCSGEEKETKSEAELDGYHHVGHAMEGFFLSWKGLPDEEAHERTVWTSTPVQMKVGTTLMMHDDYQQSFSSRGCGCFSKKCQSKMTMIIYL